MTLRAMSEARQAEDRFRRVVEAAPNALIMADGTGTIRLVNARAESVFGYSRDELVGLPIETLLPERHGPGQPQSRVAYLDEPTARSMGAGRELFGRRKDGTEIPVEIGLNPIHARDGDFVLASVIDITERRRAELDFEQLRNELAHLSRLTTIGELAGSLAHEINQPLTAILSNAQAAHRLLSRETPDLEEVSAILLDIVDSDMHAGEVISRLRAMLRKQDDRYERLDVNEIVQEVLKLARSDLLNNGVAVATELENGLPAISGDRVQLLQVFLNLLLNGCDAMGEEPRVRRRLLFETRSWDDGGIHVSVADSGTGIPEAEIARIFEPFFTTKGHGMGLGLSVCRTIVAAHGGKIWATNNSAAGATLHLVLPAVVT
jgi:PAS domain S-box-containing protein